jgi:GT2 family glycosyltransferase
MRVAALVLTRERPAVLAKCVQSLLRQTRRPDDIVILDNGSSPGMGITRDLDPALENCSLLKSERNLGCPGGRNLLISSTGAEFLLLVDDDGELAPDALERALAAIRRRPNIAVVTFRIIDPTTGAVRDGLSGGLPFFHHTFGGGSCLIRRNVLDEVGAFPEDYSRQGEEHDLALRLIDRGYAILYEPRCILLHGSSCSGASSSVWRLVLLAPITTAWRLMPWPYAVLRTLLNTLRGLLRAGDDGGRCLYPADTMRAVLLGLRTRRPISRSSYRRWRSLHRHVRLKVARSTPCGNTSKGRLPP